VEKKFFKKSNMAALTDLLIPVAILDFLKNFFSAKFASYLLLLIWRYGHKLTLA
jgi:hypothetical protein